MQKKPDCTYRPMRKISYYVSEVRIFDPRAFARLHIKALPNTANSVLGTEHVEKIYKIAYSCNTSKLFVAMHENSLVGMVGLALDFSELKKITSNNISFMDKICALLKLFSRPSLLIELFTNFFFNPRVPYIFSIAVAPEFSGCGIGLSLLNKVEEFLKASKFEGVCVQTKVDNSCALGLYHKAGYFSVTDFLGNRLLGKSLI